LNLDESKKNENYNVGKNNTCNFDISGSSFSDMSESSRFCGCHSSLEIYI